MNSVDVRRLSVEAQVDPKTIYRYLRGERVRPTSEERIVAAAKRLRLKVKEGSR